MTQKEQIFEYLKERNIPKTSLEANSILEGYELGLKTVQDFIENLLNIKHEFVDLGLSVNWATCNIGANKPEEFGDYFAWGETEPKSTYSMNTYKYCKCLEITFTKYNTRNNYDNKTTLELIDDAAHVAWGDNWHIPTCYEIKELIDKCTWTWTSQNGVIGYKLTSKINGNSIFLPAAGYRSGVSIINVGYHCGYWSSSLYKSSPYNAYYFDFRLGSIGCSYSDRHYGRTIRAVCPK